MTAKTIHRLCSILALLLMLWMGLSGLVMQAADLTAISTHQRGDSPTRQATDEGKYGAGDYTVISLRDYGAAPIPAGFDYPAALRRVLGAAASAGLPPPRFVELRTADGHVVGSVTSGSAVRRGPMVEQPVASFDAATGRAIPPVVAAPKGPPLPPSWRSTGLEFHRFFSHGGGAGVWMMLLAGIVIWVMLITGLSFYFKMLKQRRKIKRPGLFWKAGGWWRTLHRGVSVGAAVFLVLIAFSGTWMALESVWHSFRFFPEQDTSAPIGTRQAERMARTTLAAFRAQHPDTPIRALRLRWYSGIPQGVVVAGGADVSQYVYQAETGRPQSLTEPGYPPSRFPFGDQVHQSMKRFHSGSDYGVGARVLNLLAGLSLVYLAISGLVLYATMWRQRRRTGRPALIWT